MIKVCSCIKSNSFSQEIFGKFSKMHSKLRSLDYRTLEVDRDFWRFAQSRVSWAVSSGRGCCLTFEQNFLYLGLCPLSLVLSLGTAKSNLAPSSLYSPIRYGLWGFYLCILHLFFRLNVPDYFNFSSFRMPHQSNSWTFTDIYKSNRFMLPY